MIKDYDSTSIRQPFDCATTVRRPVLRPFWHYRNSIIIIIDVAWPFSVFTPKQVFGPRTAKSQPIWIKFCTQVTQLLLYGIVGRLRPRSAHGQLQAKPERLCFFVTCNAPSHHKSYIETTDLVRRCASRRLQLNAIKTEAVWFGTRRNLDRLHDQDRHVQIDSEIIYPVTVCHS